MVGIGFTWLSLGFGTGLL